MTAECQQPITMLPHHHASNLQNYQQHQQQGQQLMQHQHQYNQESRHQMIVSSQFQDQQPQVRQVQSRCSPVQVYAGGQVSMAPPTPPSDEAPTYQLVAVQRQAWSAPSSEQANHQQQISNSSAGYYQQPAQPTTTIANYYYDIDDEFSDILSAPPTPEPMMLGAGHHHNHHHHHHHHNHHSHHHHQHQHQQHHIHLNHHSQHQHQSTSYPQQEQQQQQQQQHQEEPSYQQTTDYRNYLPYNQPMSLASGCGGPNAYELGSHYAMSPDSSSLSTTSSSPSDHSLYQSSQQKHQQHPHQLVQHQLQVKQEPEQEVSQQQARMGVQPLVVAAAPQVPQQQQHHHRSSPIHLWEFLKELLQQVESSEAEGVIRWVDKAKGVFKIEDSVRVAKLWGKRKNKPKMNYDKLSRSIRQYYKKGIMKKTDRSQRLVYQFCSAYCH